MQTYYIFLEGDKPIRLVAKVTAATEDQAFDIFTEHQLHHDKNGDLCWITPESELSRQVPYYTR